MEAPACREQYPLRIVLVANLLTLLIYGIGAYLFFRLTIYWAVAYLLFVLLLEFRVVSGHCPDCYYYGKTCAFGKGRIAARFFPKGSPERFSSAEITGWDVLPDFLTFFLPAIAGTVLVLRGAGWGIIGLVIALLLLGFAGTAIVRGRLACCSCRQRELGCPAERLFRPPQQ